MYFDSLQPSRSGVVRELSLNENHLEAKLTAEEPKRLRVALNGNLDLLALAAETIESFDVQIA